MKVKLCSVLVLSFFAVYAEKKQPLNIGGLFEKDENFPQKAFVRAAEWVNEGNILQQFYLVADVQEADAFDTYKVSTKVCDLLNRRVAGVFGPRSGDTSDHVQSVCDVMEIPHIEMRWDSRPRRGSCLVNLYPHPSTITKVFTDLVRAYGWQSFTVLYQDNDGLIKLHSLLSFYGFKGFPVNVRQLNYTGNNRITLREIKKTKQKNIVIDCTADILPDVLQQAQQVGLWGEGYSFIVTALDFQTIDWEPFMHGDTNMTGVRMFDPNSKEVNDMIQFWTDREKDLEITGEKLHAATAMIHDAVFLYAKALNQLLKSHVVQTKALSCDKLDNWQHGYSIINYMKLTEVTGLTGLIKFNHEGFRTDFTLDIIQLTSEGLEKIGNWNTTEGINFVGLDHIQKPNATDLRNVTFIVLIALVHPHFMYTESKDDKEGNEQFEGMGVDVIHELSLMTGFNYTFKLQKEGGSGKELEDGSWSGMIGEVMNQRADLAIADITINEERQKVVDFTLPYMNLGISILYKKPSKFPTLFQFLDPFSKSLWIWLLVTYVGISVLLYLIARISPKEWSNPYPCIDDDEIEEFENQFSLNNSFWFVTGVVLQQGSELGPISWSTRTLAGVWSIFTLIISNTYTANLTGSLAIEQPRALFETVDQLAYQKSDVPKFVKYGALRGGSTERFFSGSSHPTYRHMWEYMHAHYDDVMVDDNKKGVDRVLNTTEEYAFLMESASIQYEVQRKCTLQQVGTLLDTKGYGIVMQKGAWYRHILERSVVNLQEKGVFTQLYKKWWNEKRGGGTCDDSDKANAPTPPLGLDNVGGVFVVLVVGLIFACFVTVGELLYDTFMKKDRGPFFKALYKEILFILSGAEVKRLKPLLEEEEEEEKEQEEEKGAPDKEKASKERSPKKRNTEDSGK